MNRKASRGWEGETLDALRERWDRPHVHLYAQLDSTNSRAKELAEEDAPAGTIVLADEQTAGRGRMDRSWHSPKGAGLYMSIVFRPESLPNPLLMPLLAGLGIARAADTVLGDGDAAVKWPNDLIVSDRKAGGVLSEAAWSGSSPDYVVVGVGINVHQRPQDFPAALRKGVTSLDDAVGSTVSRLELADHVLAEVERRCARPPEQLSQEQLKEFDAYDWLRDRRCGLEESPDAAPLEGVAVGIAPDGALLFRPDRGALRRVASGRIVVPDLALPDY